MALAKESSITGNRLQMSEAGFREFYERVAECYPEEDVVYATLSGMVRRAFVTARMRELFHGRILDLGCNLGYYIAELAPARKAVGVDLSFRILSAAKRRQPSQFFIQGDAECLTFLKTDSVDSILCSEMLEHVLHPEEVFAACARILRPGGRALFTTPNYRKERPTWIAVGEMQKYGVTGVKGDLYYHTAFRPEELVSLVGRAGLRLIEFGTFEKEVKYATRLPLVTYHLTAFVNRLTVNSRWVERLNRRILGRTSLMIYKFCSLLGLNAFLKRFFDEGTRSYIVFSKDEASPKS
jgi:2-polyprenyl-3-methyl-5-hydroxy-6-metoxy-1,4-benzoquinol methylase